MAKENRDWGYDRIVGALANLGYKVCDQTVGNVLQRHALPPAPERKRTTTWAAFIRIHLALLAGADFFTAEVLTLRGLVTYYVLLFIPLGQKIEAIEGIVPARHSLVGRRAATGLMQQRIADLAISVIGLLRITLAKTGAA
jgi:hypothetical protein